MESPSEHPYDRLTPDVVITAVETLEMRTDGRILALNSYENRVYQVGIEEGLPVVVKFYRPGRWSSAAILEEHQFAFELAAAEIPVVPPIRHDGRSLFEHAGFRFAAFERYGGRWPELGRRDEREWMGRFLGRMHAVGRRSAFQHRPRWSLDVWGQGSRDFLLDEGWLPPHLEEAYASLTDDLLDQAQQWFETAGPSRYGRLHGDCHRGNVLWTEAGPHFVDLDDCLMGPAIQDLWMLLAGNRQEMAEQLGDLLSGYTQFCDFDQREVMLIESLRTVRMIHYAAWLARRFRDPAFPRAFPWFAESRYWENHILSLREQLAQMAEGPLPMM